MLKNFKTGKNQISLIDEETLYKSKNLEEDLTIYIISRLLSYGLKPTDISLITTYHKERANLFDKLHNNDVEVLTIDKSQGIDRECIIL